MSRCKGCGKEFRKGRVKEILQPSGELLTAIVCPECVRRCLCIVMPIAPPPRAPMPIDGRDLLEQVRRSLRTFRIAEEAREKTPNLSDETKQYSAGRVDGLLSAIALIDAILTDKRPI